MSLQCHAPCIHNHFVSVSCFLFLFFPFILFFFSVYLAVTNRFFSLHAVYIKMRMYRIVLFVALKHIQFMILNDDAQTRISFVYSNIKCAHTPSQSHVFVHHTCGYKRLYQLCHGLLWVSYLLDLVGAGCFLFGSFDAFSLLNFVRNYLQWNEKAKMILFDFSSR